MPAAELFDLTGKVAVITGGGGDIGVVYARALCEAGAAVVVADLDHDGAQQAASALAAKGHGAIGIAVDVSSEDSTKAMAQAALTRSVASTS